MSAITRYDSSNFIFNTNEPQRQLEIEEPISVRARTLNYPYLGQSWANTPSVFNLFFIPGDFIASVRDQCRAEALGDTEGSIENWLRIAEAPFNFSSSLFENTNLITRILIYFRAIKKQNSTPLLSTIFKAAPILGIILCGFESLIELAGFKSAHSMLKKLNLDELKKLESLKNSHEQLKNHFLRLLNKSSFLQSLLSDEEFAEFSETLNMNSCDHPDASSDEQKLILNAWGEKIRERMIRLALEQLDYDYGTCDPQKIEAISLFVREKFPQLSPQEKQAKIRYYEHLAHGSRERRLIRRVHPCCAQEFHDKLPFLINAMHQIEHNNNPQWERSACALLTDLKIQSQKKQLVHILGLLAMIITIAGLIALLCGCPYLIPIILLVIACAFSLGRYSVHEGMMHTKGWRLDAAQLVPNFLKIIYRKIFIRAFRRAPIPNGNQQSDLSIAKIPMSELRWDNP